MPETVLVDFSSHGSELAVLELDDLPARFTTETGRQARMAEYKVGTEQLEYFLPPASRSRTWSCPSTRSGRATNVPAAEISCTLTTSAGEATVSTEGALQNVSPPIDEEAEEEAEEAAEEEAEEEEEREEAKE